MSLKPLRHPHVRHGDELLFRERAADILKRTFGTWTFLLVLNALFFGWMILDFATGEKIDPGLFYANLFLSWLAGQQGGALQIAANRGDRISSELAQHTYENGQKILTINTQQLEILEELRTLNARLDDQDDTTPTDDGNRSGFFAPGNEA